MGKSHDLLAKKIASGAYVINSAKRYLSVENIQTLYHSLVHSHLMYGNLVWGSSFKNRLNKLIALYKNVLEIYLKSLITNRPHLSSNIYDTFNLQVCTLMYSYTSDLLPPSLKTLFNMHTDVHSHRAVMA